MKLTNQEIWLAYPELMKLCKVTFPVSVSLSLACLTAKLQRPYFIIEGERAKLIRRLGVIDETKKIITVAPESENYATYALELAKLFTAEWSDDIAIEKIVIPQKMLGKCEHCGQPMDIVVLIQPQILIPLAQHFVEVV